MLQKKIQNMETKIFPVQARLAPLSPFLRKSSISKILGLTQIQALKEGSAPIFDLSRT